MRAPVPEVSRYGGDNNVFSVVIFCVDVVENAQ